MRIHLADKCCEEHGSGGQTRCGESLSKRFPHEPLDEPHIVSLPQAIYQPFPLRVSHLPHTAFDVLHKCQAQIVITAAYAVDCGLQECLIPAALFLFLWFTFIVYIILKVHPW